jgi:hypothetical protein
MARDNEFLARQRSLPSQSSAPETLMIKRSPQKDVTGKAIAHRTVTSTFDARPINGADFSTSGYVTITSVAGVATATFNYNVPKGYTAIFRRVSHQIIAALVGYPAAPLVAGGVLTTLLVNNSAVANYQNMNFGQYSDNVSVYFIAAQGNKVTYSLSIVEDVAGQFNGKAFYVELGGTLLLSNDLPVNEQIGN